MKIATVLSLVALFATQASCTIVTQPYTGIKLREQHQRETKAEINNLPKGNVKQMQEVLTARSKTNKEVNNLPRGIVKQMQQKLAAGSSFPRRR